MESTNFKINKNIQKKDNLKKLNETDNSKEITLYILYPLIKNL